MTRLGAVFWGGLVLVSGFVTFNVKYAVQGIDDELARVRRQTLAEQREIRVLTAEWAYLNQPERLAELNRSFLQLTPMTAKQMQARIDEIALRAPPAAAPDTMPGTMIAATPAAASPPAVTLAAGAVSAPPLAALSARATRAGGTPAAEMQTAEASAGRVRAADKGIKSAEMQVADARSGAGAADMPPEGAAVLTEALRLLGIDAGEQTPPARLAKAAPVAAAQAAEIHGAQTRGGETQVADATGGAGAADTRSGRAAALIEALHLLGVDNGGQTPRVRLAKAAPASLDALISKIVATR
jgi:hypothetical protein